MANTAFSERSEKEISSGGGSGDRCNGGGRGGGGGGLRHIAHFQNPFTFFLGNRNATRRVITGVMEHSGWWW